MFQKGAIEGKVIHRSSTGHIIVMTPGGIGSFILPEDSFVLTDTVRLFTATTFDNNGVPLTTYGYQDGLGLDLHIFLSSIQGLGASKAFSLISTLGHQTLISALQTQDKKVLQKAPGVGAKMADTILSYCLSNNKLSQILSNETMQPINDYGIVDEMIGLVKSLRGTNPSRKDVLDFIEKQGYNIENLKDWKNGVFVNLLLSNF